MSNRTYSHHEIMRVCYKHLNIFQPHLQFLKIVLLSYYLGKLTTVTPQQNSNPTTLSVQYINSKKCNSERYGVIKYSQMQMQIQGY